MPLVGTGMGDAIKAKIKATQPPDKQPAPGDLDPFCKAIGEAIVEYLTANGLVIIPASAIATSGSATNQAGPPAPVNLQIT